MIIRDDEKAQKPIVYAFPEYMKCNTFVVD